eukprot:1177200-Lingulodinium_polyedra.AAC.1
MPRLPQHSPSTRALPYSGARVEGECCGKRGIAAVGCYSDRFPKQFCAQRCMDMLRGAHFIVAA